MTKEIAEAVVTRFYIELENKYLKKKKNEISCFYIQKGKALFKNFMLCLRKIWF